MTSEEFVAIAKALADPTRVKILQEIRTGDDASMCCSEVCECFDLSQPTISHHVGTLEAAGLLKVKRLGQYRVLAVNEKLLGEFGKFAAGAGAKPARAGKKAPQRRKAASA